MHQHHHYPRSRSRGNNAYSNQTHSSSELHYILSSLRTEMTITALLQASIQSIYLIWQYFVSLIFSPAPPASHSVLSRPRIAIIGAGLTGVSSAAHCVGHGFDVQIFEAGDRSSLGGIWAKVNSTSGLQIHSLMYRFHPSVRWGKGYPDRQAIVGEIENLWRRYRLQGKTSFGVKVDKVFKDEHGRWIVHDASYGRFDGIVSHIVSSKAVRCTDAPSKIACVGTCGAPNIPSLPSQSSYLGQIQHSSALDGLAPLARDQPVIIIGGGASAIEALEFATEANASHIYVLARSEKWIIPRNPFINILLAFNIFGAMTSFIPEALLRKFFYRDLSDLAPDGGLFTDTPIVNSSVLTSIRSGKVSWLRGDISSFTPTGILFRSRHAENELSNETHITAPLTFLATGYQRPSLSFLPASCFPSPAYSPPNWYLQVFPPSDPSICATNCTYINAIGSVGNWHVGIYTRFLLMFLVDPLARPSERRMRIWVDFARWMKRRAPGGALDFFTYAELVGWFVGVILVNPFRWKWAVFVLMGVGGAVPREVVRQEDRVRRDWGAQTSGFDQRAESSAEKVAR